MLRSRGLTRFFPNTRVATQRHATSSLTLAGSRTYTTHASVEPTTKVEKIIHDTIKATGPMSTAKYMQMCLSHPTEGYYMKDTHAVLGSKGDFITSPEISQVFGELVALWMVLQWQHFGAQKKIRLVELGPGRGTLMTDILRVFSQLAALRPAVQEVHLIETSKHMSVLQAETLKPLTSQMHCECHWHDSLDQLPPNEDVFTLLVAHEFFDALPFHLLQKSEDGWREVYIASGPDPSLPTVLKSTSNLTTPGSNIMGSVAKFHYVLSPTPGTMSSLLGASSPRFKNLPVGSRIEVSPVAYRNAQMVGKLLQSSPEAPNNVPGCALIVDYGGDKVFGSSFRGFKDHKVVDVFHQPGECDLTTNVDFAYLREAIGDFATTHGPISQATFLERMHIQARVDGLKKAANDEDRKKQIEAAARRLVDRTGMGGQYQFLAVTGTRHLQPQPDATQLWPFGEV